MELLEVEVGHSLMAMTVREDVLNCHGVETPDGLLPSVTSLLLVLCEGDIHAQFLPLTEDGESYLIAHVESP